MEAGQEQLRAASRLCVGRQRRRPDGASAAATASPTNATSATSPTTCCSTRRCIWWRRLTPRIVPGGSADLHGQRRTVRRRRGRDQDDSRRAASATSTRTSRPRTRTSMACRSRRTRRPADRVDRVQRLERPQPLRPGRRQQGGRRRSCTKASARSTTRPNTQYTAFNTRGNRGRSQYHGVVFSADSRQFGDTGLALTSKYTLSNAKDNLSGTFSDADNNGYFNLRLSGPVRSDARLRLRRLRRPAPVLGERDLERAVGRRQHVAGRLAGERAVHRAQRLSVLGVRLHQRPRFCMRALDPDRHRSAHGQWHVATGSPNEFDLLDLSALDPFAGTYAHPVQGTCDFGPYPDTMTEAERLPRPGRVEPRLDHRQAVPLRQQGGAHSPRGVQRVQPPQHVRAHGRRPMSTASRSITGFKDDFRRMQLGFKFEF